MIIYPERPLQNTIKANLIPAFPTSYNFAHLFHGFTVESRARICRSFKETRYRFLAWRAGTKPYLSYWPARLHRLAKSIPRNRFLGSINVYKYGLCVTITGSDVSKMVCVYRILEAARCSVSVADCVSARPSDGWGNGTTVGHHDRSPGYLDQANTPLPERGGGWVQGMYTVQEKGIGRQTAECTANAQAH